MVLASVIVPSSGLLLIGVLMIVMARQVDSGTLERNGSFGIRTRATRSSDAAWRVGHEAAQPVVRRTGPVALVAGVLPLATAAALQRVDDGAARVASTALCVAGYAVVLGMVTWAAVVADRAARRAAG